MLKTNETTKLKRGSIIYINFDPSAETEIQKCRPAVVVNNDILSETSPFTWGVPISHGTDYPLHVQLDNRTQTNGTVYVEQLKSFDFHQSKWQFIETMPADLFEEIQKTISD
ncbi:type II toxin-antitoxin system PemK/MazF family toxin [Limosilactobacillus reuteri]|uniref:type II toxin-antitoxin system PemK/MazF family toxin n=1 Tax=Limosilactobacillus reuteri TaxID=1598 RepID=UPI001E400E5B|nr:type II toxin-antitoxin system PemK/MazF family toxin [Limosilactobacillus reuteri]MCC4491411.1 type II toxin-antitoxin system PemK/MazF family toxin [Limosilactobacillus reuteri]